MSEFLPFFFQIADRMLCDEYDFTTEIDSDEDTISNKKWKRSFQKGRNALTLLSINFSNAGFTFRSLTAGITFQKIIGLTN